MIEELNTGSEEIGDLELNMFFEFSEMEVLETAQNFSPDSQPWLPTDCKFLINRFIFILFYINFQFIILILFNV
jgi:hypothetical protein